MRLHKSTSEAVIDALTEIFENRRYADKVIERILKSNPKWGSRDRKFIAETTYEMVRWWRLIQYLSGDFTISSKQDYWSMLGVWLIKNNIELPSWNEFSRINKKSVSEKLKKTTEFKITASIPDWLDELGGAEIGNSWQAEMNALNKQASVVLRTNTLKVSKEKLKDSLAKDNVFTEEIEGYPDALVLNERSNVFRTFAFKKGWFEVQDGSSQLIADYLQLEPGMRVIDACAGGGGKTLHVAAKLQNKGRIIAMDIEAWKLQELKKRAKRAGASTIETRLIESSKTIKRLANSADRLLLDVPCSGLGVLKRNPDAKWKLDLDFLERVQQTQAEIIHSYSRMLKPGGLMVYATCSILPSENRKQVDTFLANHSEFEFIEDRPVMPSEGFDGFYMAAMRKK